MMTDIQLKELVTSLAISQTETNKQFQESDRRFKETDKQLLELVKQIGGCGTSVLE